MSVLVVGSMAIDTVEFEGTGERHEVVGGSAVFAALAVAQCGHPRVVGIVGKDFPSSTMEQLRQRNIDLSAVEIADGNTFRWHGRYTADLSSRVSLATHLNVFETFHPKIPAGFRSTPYLLLGNIHPSLQMDVLNQMERPKLIVADTMNFWIRGELQALKNLLKRVDLLVINEEEARELSGERHISKVGRALRSLGPTYVVVKQGEYGAFLFDDHGVFHAPAYPVEHVVDPTGAGDSFAGAMLGYISEHNSTDRVTLRRAVTYGSAVASICVEHLGTTGLFTASKDQIDHRVKAFLKLVHAEH